MSKSRNGECPRRHRRVPAGLAYAFGPRSPKHAGKSTSYPLSLTLLEFAGMAYGPVGYLRSRLSR